MAVDLIIAGDSWGCGEWQVDPSNMDNLTNTHQGTEYFLKKRKYSVINVSAPGGSNLVTWYRLRHIKHKSPIIVFQTDPFRDVLCYNTDWYYTEGIVKQGIKRPTPYPFSIQELTKAGLKDKKIFDLPVNLTLEQFLDRQNQMLDFFYQLLNKINQRIFMIGGCTKLNLSLMQKYPNLIPLVECFSEWLQPQIVHPPVWKNFGWNDWISDDTPPELVDFLYKSYQQQQDLINFKYFPDGRHPDRHAHEKLADLLEKVLTS